MSRAIRKFNVTQDHLALDDILRLAELGLLGRLQRDSKVFYVNADTTIGNDTHKGFPYEAPLNTIAAALALCTTGKGDFILIQPSPGTNITEVDVSIAKADVTIAGLNDPTLGSIIIKPTADPSTAIFAMTAAADRVQIMNLQFDGTGDGGVDVVCINAVGGANNVVIKNCLFRDGNAAITTSNVATCGSWIIEDNRILDMAVHGISGYLGEGQIRRNEFINTDNSAWSTGAIKLLDNTTTAESDGCQIKDNEIMAGVTAVMAKGIWVVANCIDVGIFRNWIGGAPTKPIIVADGVDGTGGNSIMRNLGIDDGHSDYSDYEGVVLGATS